MRNAIIDFMPVQEEIQVWTFGEIAASLAEMEANEEEEILTTDDRVGGHYAMEEYKQDYAEQAYALDHPEYQGL